MRLVRDSLIGLYWAGLITGCAGLLQGPPSPGAPTDEERRRATQYFVRAKVFEAQKNYYGAIVQLRNAADLTPRSPTIYQQLALAYQQIDDYQMAAAFARKTLALDPGRSQLRLRLVQWLERLGRHRQAVGELETLLDYEPDNWRLYSYLTFLYRQTGQDERIAPLYEKILARTDAPTEVRVHVGDIFIRLDLVDRARAVYEEILQGQPDTRGAWVGMARLALKEGRRETAIQHYRRAAQIVPQSNSVLYELADLLTESEDLDELIAEEDVEFLYQLGTVLSEIGRYAQAVRLFEHIVKGEPSTPGEWLELARHYVYLEDYDQVDRVMQQAVQATSDNRDLYLFWGMIMEQAGRVDQAIAVYQQGIESYPQEADFYMYWGFALEKQEEWDQAQAIYRRGLAVNPEAMALHMRWGIALGKQEAWEKAIRQFRHVVQVDSSHSEAWLRWGLGLQRLERWEEALAKVERASALDDQDRDVLFYLGSALEQAAHHLGKAAYFERAVSTFQQLLALDPTDAYALNYLGYMYADKGIELDKAVELLLRAIALEPAKSPFLDSLGWAYFRLGELDRAQHYIEQALETMSQGEPEELAVIFDHAGDIAQALGKREEARRHWQRALELGPENQDVQRKLADVEVP